MQDYLYSVIAAVAIVVQLIINYKVMFMSNTDKGRKAGKIYRFLMLSMLAYYVTDTLWGIFAGLNWIPALFIDTTIYYVAMSLIIVFCYFYFVEYSDLKGWLARFFKIFGLSFLVLEVIFLIINIFQPCFFWFDKETDAYIAGPVRYIALWVQVAMFAFSSIVTFIRAMRVNGAYRKRYLAIFFFSFTMLVAIIFQEKFPLLPFYALGCLLGSCVLHVYVVGDEQDEASIQLSNYKQAILSDAMVALEANLTKDELYYGVWKDDDGNEISLKDIVGLELPCSNTKYQEICNEKYVLGKTDDFLASLDTNKMLEAFDKGIKEITFDYEATTLSGNHAWLRRSVAMTRNQNGHVIAYTNVKNVSNLIEQKMREEAYMHALATEYDSIAIVEIDNKDKMNDRVLIHGRLTDKLFNLIDEATANEQIYSKKLDLLLRFVYEDDKEYFYEETRREKILSVCGKDKTHLINFRIIDKEKDYSYFQMRFIPLKDASNIITAIVAGIKNVDDEVRKDMKAREELQEAKHAAESASRAKTTFLFNMSHDIRTPMNAILGYTNLAIKHREDQSRVDDSLDKIKTAGVHLLDLINDILEMSRIESGRLEITNEPSDIRKLINGVDQMTRSLAIAKSIDFKTEEINIANPYVYLDELHANEVLINLTSNAVKYTPAGGKIRLKVNQIGPVLDGKATFRFDIEDNGIGMSKEFQEHLFEAFSREKTSTVSKQQGAGLGLSIVKKIVDLAGGNIRVISEQNKGSTFIIEMPLCIMDDEAIKAYNNENQPIMIKGSNFSLENKKVLVVEDNEMNREIAAEILQETGLIVESVEDGEFAVEAIKEKGVDYYDFILMDIQMPVMDGYEATRVIRSFPDGDKVKIIALSANAFEEDVQKSLSMGMNAHVAKPINVNALFETMKNLTN